MSYDELEKMVQALSQQDVSKLLQVLLGRYCREPFHQSSEGAREAVAGYASDKGVGYMEVQLKMLLDKLIHLPAKQQAEVGDFIDFLHQRHAARQVLNDAGNRSEQPGVTDLFGTLDWDVSFDYKQERSRKP